jgi:anti-sigma factor RsiW
MKTPDQNDRITRWLDGAMSAPERTAFQTEIQANPALRSEIAPLEKLGEFLRNHASVERPVPNADFFNAQIQERISELRHADGRRKPPAREVGFWSGWLRARWALAGAAALLAIGLFIALHESEPRTQVVSLYVPDPAVKASVNYSAAAEATVLTLDGLDDYPDDKPVSEAHGPHRDNDPGTTPSTLHDDAGKALLVMATEVRNRPRLTGRGIPD